MENKDISKLNVQMILAKKILLTENRRKEGKLEEYTLHGKTMMILPQAQHQGMMRRKICV